MSHNLGLVHHLIALLVVFFFIAVVSYLPCRQQNAKNTLLVLQDVADKRRETGKCI